MSIQIDEYCLSLKPIYRLTLLTVSTICFGMSFFNYTLQSQEFLT